MLVLTRGLDEEVHLTVDPEELRKLADQGGELFIRLAVVRVDRGRVRLGIAAPQAVQVERPGAKRRHPREPVESR